MESSSSFGRNGDLNIPLMCVNRDSLLHRLEEGGTVEGAISSGDPNPWIVWTEDPSFRAMQGTQLTFYSGLVVYGIDRYYRFVRENGWSRSPPHFVFIVEIICNLHRLAHWAMQPSALSQYYPLVWILLWNSMTGSDSFSTFFLIFSDAIF